VADAVLRKAARHPWPIAPACYTQSGDYIFYVKADAAGKFTLPAVRPGTYTLYAWQTQGPITQSFAKDGIEVKGDTLDLGAVEWDAPYHPNLVFQVGRADRMAGEFKFGSAPRTNQWVNQIPSDLAFTVGQSKEASDWFYAQHSGTWAIKFNVTSVPVGNAYLTIPVAGGPGNVTVFVNGTEVGNIAKGDDASVRRAANRSGVYARYEFTFPGATLKAGENVVSLQMPARGGRRGGAAPGGNAPTGQQPGSMANNGIMYDTVVLETD
jgi:rhamnogalacturonan endolyase